MVFLSSIQKRTKLQQIAMFFLSSAQKCNKKQWFFCPRVEIRSRGSFCFGVIILIAPRIPPGHAPVIRAQARPGQAQAQARRFWTGSCLGYVSQRTVNEEVTPPGRRFLGWKS